MSFLFYESSIQLYLNYLYGTLLHCFLLGRDVFSWPQFLKIGYGLAFKVGLRCTLRIMKRFWAIIQA
jgi:hypothetical protein